MSAPRWHSGLGLNKTLPDNLLKHAENLNQQLRDIQRARNGQRYTPPWLFDHISSSAMLLCEKVALELAAMVDSQETFGNCKAGLSILVPVEDPEAVSRLRLLSVNEVFHMVRSSIIETRRWLPDDSRDANVVGVRRLGAHSIEVFVDREEDKTALASVEEWKEVLVENLMTENVRYGVYLQGVKRKVLANLQTTTDARLKAAAEIYKDNKTRLELLYDDHMITSVEISPKISPTSSVIINFKSPEIANEAIKKGIFWHGKKFPCQKFMRAASLLQCSNCQTFGHTANRCLSSVRCGHCAQHHATETCSVDDAKCANCGKAHRSDDLTCIKRKRLSQALQIHASEVGSLWDSQERYLQLSLGPGLSLKPRTINPRPRKKGDKGKRGGYDRVSVWKDLEDRIQLLSDAVDLEESDEAISLSEQDERKSGQEPSSFRPDVPSPGSDQAISVEDDAATKDTEDPDKHAARGESPKGKITAPEEPGSPAARKITTLTNDPQIGEMRVQAMSADTIHQDANASAPARSESPQCNLPAPEQLEAPAPNEITKPDQPQRAQQSQAHATEAIHEESFTNIWEGAEQAIAPSTAGATVNPPLSPLLPPLIVRFRRLRE
ncbi:MAG: hypothetical protein Q9222_000314 [Ikaeria aurantiellina]